MTQDTVQSPWGRSENENVVGTPRMQQDVDRRDYFQHAQSLKQGLSSLPSPGPEYSEIAMVTEENAVGM